MRSMCVWTEFASTKGNRGHSHTYTPSWGTRKKEAVANEGGAASDGGRDVAAGNLGIESGTTTRCECQPAVPLAKALSRRAAGHANQLPAGESRQGAGGRGRDRERFPGATRNHGD